MPELPRQSAGGLLDRARAGKEIGTLVALVLIQTSGDPDAAVALLDDIDGLVVPESIEELDAVPIARQAIMEAAALRGGADA